MSTDLDTCCRFPTDYLDPSVQELVNTLPLQMVSSLAPEETTLVYLSRFGYQIYWVLPTVDLKQPLTKISLKKRKKRNTKNLVNINVNKEVKETPQIKKT